MVDRLFGTVTRLNVERFRSLLADETNEEKRQTLLRLLSEEEAKLAMPEDAPDDSGVKTVQGGKESETAHDR